jgi:purine-nucleoside/S-methyl-5'-thioadenosine phosphorylase / adenosine deaminase
MPFKQSSQIRYFTFNLLDGRGPIHAIFTRWGGVSTSPWQSLNVGGTVGDKLEHVQENRQRSFRAVGLNPGSIYDAWQVHGREVVVADQPRKPGEAYRQADILLTDRPGVTLFMRFADCVPLMLYDPRQGVVGLVHAGWRGTVEHAPAAAVQAMQVHFNSQPADILAGIGPSIGWHHYPVGEEVVQQVQTAFGERAAGILIHQNGSTNLDLWAANRMVLEDCGVEKIEISGLCTACEVNDWYSHRGESGKTGRFGALIALSA